MGFADFYFTRFKIYNSHFPEQKPFPDLKIIVTIPAYREFQLFNTLECLSRLRPGIKVEVIILFNTKAGEDMQIVEMHRRQAEKVSQFSNENTEFIAVVEENLPVKIAGAGLARKLAMDIALKRFNEINNKDGIILSLDADTMCEENYFDAVYNAFEKHPKAPGATIAFEHPVEGDEFPQEIYDAIVLYELYMRYYIQALRYVSFPYAYHTVGSAFAVRAWAYARQGGMGLQQAGEDFYFLHKIIPLGHFFEIKETVVHPSPRVSNRVPFGTGPEIREIISQKKRDYPTYPLEAFVFLKPLFEHVRDLYTQDPSELNLVIWLEEFLEQNGFRDALAEMRANSSSPQTFEKRFYSWFDAFRVLKYLNFMTSGERLALVPVTQVARQLLLALGEQPGFGARSLLDAYRKLQN